MPPRHDGAVELRYLRTFVTVAEEGSITRAAARLRVAQPALSRQLHALEHELGAALLERNSRGILLTEAGQAFADDARRVLAALDAAVATAQARARGTSGELHIGYAPSPTAEILPRALRALERAAPEVRITLHDLGGDELLGGLRERRLHLAVMVDPGALLPANVVFQPLVRYAHRVACAVTHAFARRKHVPLARLAAEPLVVYDRRHYTEYLATVREVLAPVTATPRIAADADGFASLLAAVRAGRGVAIVPEVFGKLAGAGVRLRSIHPAPPPLTVGYAHRVDLPLSPIARRLIKILKDLRPAESPRPRAQALAAPTLSARHPRGGA